MAILSVEDVSLLHTAGCNFVLNQLESNSWLIIIAQLPD